MFPPTHPHKPADLGARAQGQDSLVGVQVLRGVAAMLVVLAHATQMVQGRLGFGEILHFGASGVDIFFPISGFVMVITTYKHWGKAGVALDFLARRLIRIVPLYWAATLLKLLATLALPALTSYPVLDAWHVTASFLFLPAWNADHLAFPLLPVGWTLNFEMFFYALFTIVLSLRLRPVWWLGAILLFFSVAPMPEGMGPFAALAEPMLMEFWAGMLIGWATLTGHKLPAGSGWACMAAAFVALAVSQVLPESTAFAYRLWVWGFPGCVALLSVIALEPVFSKHLAGWPQRVGDASYAIYLSHGFVLPVVGVAFSKLGLAGQAWGLVAIAAGCAVSAVAGVFVHKVLERPVTRWLTRLFRERRAQWALST
jgi:exopolysaccharide production protein ExoZ